MTRNDELAASIRELEALLPTADAASRRTLEMQIEALRSTMAMLARAAPAMEETKKHRPHLTPEVAAFFRPEAPAPIPAWLPDDVERAQIDEAMMRCPAGARVYVQDDGVSCAIPGVPGQSLSVANGLSLKFYSTGKLTTQSFFEHGLVRWSIGYHALGGRSEDAFYSDVERFQYRQHGLHTSYAPNGTITSQTSFVHGVRHGWSKQWEDDGFPIGATLYDNGRAVEEVYPDGTRRQG